MVPVLNESSAGEIKDHQRKAVTAISWKTKKAMMEERAQYQGFGSLNEKPSKGFKPGSVGNWDPVLISLVRAMPNLMAYDVCGVQPMSATGLIFAMKNRYGAGSASSREHYSTKQKLTSLVLVLMTQTTCLVSQVSLQVVTLLTHYVQAEQEQVTLLPIWKLWFKWWSISKKWVSPLRSNRDC